MRALAVATLVVAGAVAILDARMLTTLRKGRNLE
jgi:hypothetical protein